MEFVNAQEMAKNHPATFDAPTADQLAAIKPGDFVKVSIGKERFWNIVKSINGNVINAVVNNNLLNTKHHGYRCDDEIQFKLDNVFDIMEG